MVLLLTIQWSSREDNIDVIPSQPDKLFIIFIIIIIIIQAIDQER